MMDEVRSGAMMSISDLRDHPLFQAAIADRIWRAWWEARGVPLGDIAGSVADNLGEGPIPSAFVAHDGDRFLGTASVILSDLDERPQYTPWLAAVWVEPEARGAGLGARLVAHATEAIFRAGFQRAYLTAAPHRRSFYDGLGWTVLEEPVGAERLTVFIRDRQA
jgi:GNAT superfamily N-acetyltransferase